MNQKILKTKIYHQIDIYFDDSLNNSTPEYLFQETETDENGNTVSELQYNTEGAIISEHRCEYANDKLVKEITKENGEIIDNSEYVYNNDLLIEEIHYYDDGLSEKTINTYDDDKMLVAQESYDSEGNLNEKLVFTNNGNKVLKIEYEDEDGNKSPYQNFEYDEHGNLIKKTYINLDEKTLETDNSYNEQGQLIKTIDYNEFGDIDNIEKYSYDDNSHITETIHQSHDYTLNYHYEFNDDGNVCHYTVTNSKDELIQETTHNYSNGNIIDSVTTSTNKELSRKEIEKTHYEYQ